jgi:hypothetical protein
MQQQEMAMALQQVQHPLLAACLLMLSMALTAQPASTALRQATPLPTVRLC